MTSIIDHSPRWRGLNLPPVETEAAPKTPANIMRRPLAEPPMVRIREARPMRGADRKGGAA